MGAVFTAGACTAGIHKRGGNTRTTGRAKQEFMAESVYKVIELVGTSTESWERAARAAVDRAGKSLRDLLMCPLSRNNKSKGRDLPHIGETRELP
jgi:hypothetical protein